MMEKLAMPDPTEPFDAVTGGPLTRSMQDECPVILYSIKIVFIKNIKII